MTSTPYVQLKMVRPLQTWMHYSLGRNDFENCTVAEYEEFEKLYLGSYDTAREFADAQFKYDSFYKRMQESSFHELLNYDDWLKIMESKGEFTSLRGFDKKLHVFNGRLPYTDPIDRDKPTAPSLDWNDINIDEEVARFESALKDDADNTSMEELEAADELLKVNYAQLGGG